MKTQPVIPATTAYNYLQRAQQLLEKPHTIKVGDIYKETYSNSWIQNAEAMSEDGHYCKPENERAVAWCTIGVVRAVTHYDEHPENAYKYVLSLLNMANPQIIQQGSIPVVNDHSPFEQVIRMFEKAKTLAIKFGG